MLRITVSPAPDAIRVVLEGRLVDAWVAEAGTAWDRARAGRGSRPLEVDLREVLAIDEGGRALIARMSGDGARLLVCGCAMREMVREITAANRSDAGSWQVGSAKETRS